MPGKRKKRSKIHPDTGQDKCTMQSLTDSQKITFAILEMLQVSTVTQITKQFTLLLI